MSEITENELALVEDVLSNNEYEFKYKDVDYKVVKPSFKQKQEVYRKKSEKFSSLLKNKELLLEKDLIAQFKERGININEFDDKIAVLEQEKNSLKEKLGKALAIGAPESDLKTFKDEIIKIINEQTSLTVQKFSYLQFSLENQLKMFAYTYVTILITFVKKDDKWVRIWNTFEEFEAYEDEDFINSISFYTGMILKDEVL